MIRVCVICEGTTEVEFVNRCLEPYLRPSGVGAYGTVLSARSGRHRGGRVTVDRLAKKISLHYCEADRITTLVDFYGFQDRAARNRAQLEGDIVAAARAITTGYDARFVLPYVQMHEFEGLLFTNPADFEWAEDGWSEDVMARLMAVAQAFASPEDINDSPETAPSKRILSRLPRRHLFQARTRPADRRSDGDRRDSRQVPGVQRLGRQTASLGSCSLTWPQDGKLVEQTWRLRFCA